MNENADLNEIFDLIDLFNNGNENAEQKLVEVFNQTITTLTKMYSYFGIRAFDGIKYNKIAFATYDEITFYGHNFDGTMSKSIHIPPCYINFEKIDTLFKSMRQSELLYYYNLFNNERLAHQDKQFIRKFKDSMARYENIDIQYVISQTANSISL